MTSRMPEHKCLACGEALDSATNFFEGKQTPEPGDKTICIKCGHVMAFDDGLKFRELTPFETLEAAGDLRVLKSQLALAMLHKFKKSK
jgi:hypothetical protein